jgi:L-fucose isomerase
MAKSRLIGDYPVIGIRPTIDARRGILKVRESLETQTMNMAKAAANLFAENLKYSNGEPVKVVIADTTIGRVAESAACAAQFKKEGVDITLTVTPCWCYGAETMDMDPMTIKGVWGFNGTERPGAVYLASVLASHAQKGLPAFGIYGHDVQGADETGIPEDVKKNCLDLLELLWQQQQCAENLICKLVLSAWELQVRSSVQNSLKNILVCG